MEHTIVRPSQSKSKRHRLALVTYSHKENGITKGVVLKRVMRMFKTIVKLKNRSGGSPISLQNFEFCVMMEMYSALLE